MTTMNKQCFCALVLVWVSLGGGLPAAESKTTPAQAKFVGEMIFLRDFGADEVGFLSVPQQQPQLGVLVVPDSRGLDTRVKKLCDALAARGYLALAVDIYNGRLAEDDTQARANRKSIDRDAVRKALETGLNFYAKSPRFQMQRIAMVSLGDGDEFALALCRETKNRSLAVASLAGGTIETDGRGLRQRIQRLDTAAAADPEALAGQLHTFWSLPETKKNFFERLVE